MSTWDDRWGKVIADRKATQDRGLAERVQRIDDGLAARQERLRPRYMNPEVLTLSGGVRQTGRGPAAIDVNVDTKVDTLTENTGDAFAYTLPRGANVNDTIRWNGTAWIILPAPSTSGTWIKGVVDGTMVWIEGAGC